ncbi:MAG: hypothetical protein GF332_00560 [Candidatus Moranbacteria bacterium]|nr:hypothetical protein [Candidatus Moranbacteria bacterium]
MKKKLFIIFILILLAGAFFYRTDLYRIYLYLKNYQANQHLKEQQYLQQKAQELKKRSNEKRDKPEFCGNSYLPLGINNYWLYNSTYNNVETEADFQVIEQTPEKAVLSYKMPREQFNQRIPVFCQEQGVVFENIDFLLGQMNTNQITTFQHSNGIFLPKNFDNRHNWQFEVTNKLEILDSQGQQIIDRYFEKNNLSFQLQGEEQISGIYNQIWAKKIHLDWRIKKFNPEQPELEDPHCTKQLCKNERLVQCNLWLAEQTGIIKSFCVLKQDRSREVVSFELKKVNIWSR